MVLSACGAFVVTVMVTCGGLHALRTATSHAAVAEAVALMHSQQHHSLRQGKPITLFLKLFRACAPTLFNGCIFHLKTNRAFYFAKQREKITMEKHNKWLSIVCRCASSVWILRTP